MTEETDKIVCFDEHPHSFNLPDTDFKAEVVASGLKEAGYDAERTLISRKGDIRRGFSKDIHDIHSEYSHYDLTDYLYLYVNRRSLYDALPEGIFHKNLYQSEKISKNFSPAVSSSLSKSPWTICWSLSKTRNAA